MSEIGIEENKEEEKEESDVIIKLDKIITTFSSQLNILLDGINNLYNFIKDSEVHYILENMFQSAIDLSKYVNNIQDYKKYLLNENITFTNEEIGILELIKEIYKIYNMKLESYGIKFNYTISNTLRDNNISIDKKYLKQILVNILDIIITDIEEDIMVAHKKNLIYFNIEYIDDYIEFNIYYTSNKKLITMNDIKSNNYDTYYIKYNIINLLIKHLEGDIMYYDKLDNMISYDKHINFKLKTNLIEKTKGISNINKKIQDTLAKKDNKTVYILSNNKLYISIVKKALSYFDDKCNMDIIELNNIKIGFNYLIKNISNKNNYLILDLEYNNLTGLDIINYLYKYINIKFIITTSIEVNNIESYIGKDIMAERIFLYKKPINEHNIAKLENFLLNPT